MNHEGFPAGGYQNFAFDTETVDGFPYTLQVTDPTGATTLDYLTPAGMFPALLRRIAPAVSARRPGSVVLWGHNLGFDLVALLYPQAKRFREGRFTHSFRGVEIDVCYGNNPFATITFPHNRVVHVADTFAFVGCSLKQACEVWKLPIRKAPRPRGLGRRVLRGSAFEAYAKIDSEAAWYLGQWLLDFHAKHDIRLCVSAAQFAARLFAHVYLDKPWPPIPRDVLHASLAAYHGGVNGFFTDPGWVEDCIEWDISSAYPWMMTTLPPMHRGTWKQVRSFDPHHEGFYLCDGVALDEKSDLYPVAFSHAFQPLRGRFSGVWIASHEVREAIRSGDVRFTRLAGHVWVPRMGVRRNVESARPLRRYAQDLYQFKSSAQDGPERQMWKLLLNSLYGKFIQLNEHEADDGSKYWTPGRYFHPVTAAWITAGVRARMHRLAHEMGALMVATDALWTRPRPKSKFASVPSEGLGSLEEAIRGPALLVRNKVYFHFDATGTEMRAARHGIQCGTRYLWNLLMKGKRRYRKTHLLRPKEAARRGDRPLRAVTYWPKINVPAFPVDPVPDAARTFWRDHPKG